MHITSTRNKNVPENKHIIIMIMILIMMIIMIWTSSLEAEFII